MSNNGAQVATCVAEPIELQTSVSKYGGEENVIKLTTAWDVGMVSSTVLHQRPDF